MNERFEWDACQVAIADRLQSSFGYDRERAMVIAEVSADAIRKQFGGERHYLPKKNGTAKARIQEEFNGRNIAILSQTYGVSCMTVRRYVAKK